MTSPYSEDGGDFLEHGSLINYPVSLYGNNDTERSYIDHLQSTMDNFEVCQNLSSIPAQPCEAGGGGSWPMFIPTSPQNFGVHMASSCIGHSGGNSLSFVSGHTGNSGFEVTHRPYAKDVKYDGFLPEDETKENDENSKADEPDESGSGVGRQGDRKARNSSEKRSSRSQSQSPAAKKRRSKSSSRNRETQRAGKNRRSRKESKTSSRASNNRSRSSDNGKSRRRNRSSQNRRRQSRNGPNRRRNRSGQSRRTNRSGQNRRRRGSCRDGVCKLRRSDRTRDSSKSRASTARNRRR